MAGSTIRDGISGLHRPRRGTFRPKKTKTQGTLLPKAGVGKPAPRTTGGEGQAVTAYIEQSRNFHTELRELRSTDGLFVLEYYNVKDIVMDNATFTYLDYDPDAEE